eukprot:gene7915-12383_t
MKVLVAVLFLVFYAAISSPVTCVRNDVAAATLDANVQCLFGGTESEPDLQYWCEANCPGGFVDLQDKTKLRSEFTGLFCEKNVHGANCPCSAIMDKADPQVKNALNSAVSRECSAIASNSGSSSSGNPAPSPANSGPPDVKQDPSFSSQSGVKFAAPKFKSAKKTKKTIFKRITRKFGRKGASVTLTLDEEANALELKAQQLEEAAEALESSIEE